MKPCSDTILLNGSPLLRLSIRQAYRCSWCSRLESGDFMASWLRATRTPDSPSEG